MQVNRITSSRGTAPACWLVRAAPGAINRAAVLLKPISHGQQNIHLLLLQCSVRLGTDIEQEIPSATAVVVEDISPRQDGLIDVSATIYVERETQKGMVIGKGGKMLREVGKAARIDMEGLLEKRVFLQLWVKVKKGWTDREGLLRQLGYR